MSGYYCSWYFSPSLLNADLAGTRILSLAYFVRSFSNFVLIIQSVELTAGHSKLYLHTARLSWIVSNVWLLL